MRISSQCDEVNDIPKVRLPIRMSTRVAFEPPFLILCGCWSSYINFANQDGKKRFPNEVRLERMPIDVDVQQLRQLKNFGDGCPGCGSLLAAKLLLQSVDNIMLVNGTGSATPFLAVDVPFIHAGMNAASVARGVSRSCTGEKSPKVVVFAGDGSTAAGLSSLLDIKDDMLYVCYNDFGYNAINHYTGRSFAHLLSNASYVATASVAHPEDYISKIKKSMSKTGLRFIEVLAPCPVFWKYDPSNTIEVSRVAVETGVWPLYEVEDGTANLTKRPNRLEPVENLGHVQKRIQPTRHLQETVNRRWKLLTEGRLM